MKYLAYATNIQYDTLQVDIREYGTVDSSFVVFTKTVWWWFFYCGNKWRESVADTLASHIITIDKHQEATSTIPTEPNRKYQ